MRRHFWVVEVACGWFVANGWLEEGAGFVSMVGMVGFDETHGKWSTISGLYRLDVGGGWSEQGDRLEAGKTWQTM